MAETNNPALQLHWHGTCIHDFQTPKWVQKRRQVESSEKEVSRVYEEPKRATAVAVNNKFSLIAIGTYGYASNEPVFNLKLSDTTS